MNQSKTWTKHISCKWWKYKIQEKILCAKRTIFEILVHVLVKALNVYRKHYYWLSNYMWWDYRGDKNYANKF